MVMAARSKPDVRSKPETIASDLPVSERVMLFCLASGTDWVRAGVRHATAQQVLLRGLIDRASTRARFKLTPLGRGVLAALLKPPVDDQGGWSRRAWRTRPHTLRRKSTNGTAVSTLAAARAGPLAGGGSSLIGFDERKDSPRSIKRRRINHHRQRL
jgi:hypothetical protein